MNTIICTLFENDYHYGVAALINSLYYNGYLGEIFVGYKGSLPQWSLEANESNELLWTGSHSFKVTEKLQVHFLPIDTHYHLTNYKPNFMLRVWNDFAKDAGAIAYFDPDIVIKCRWEFYESWMSHGVALVHEVVSNDMPPSHPIRLEWKKIIESCNRQQTREIYSYINAGFCGVSKENVEFIEVWADILDCAIQKYKPDVKRLTSFDKTSPFCFFDQDALNVAAMCCESPISEIGPEGMDFIHGGWTMSHAVGAPKPWKKRFLLSALKGNSPSLPDKAFWLYANGPIQNNSSIKIKVKRASISVASFIGRFYRR